MFAKIKVAVHDLRCAWAALMLDRVESLYETAEREQDELIEIGGNISRILDLEHEKLRLLEKIRQRRRAVNKLLNPT